MNAIELTAKIAEEADVPFNADMLKFAKAVAEECAKIVEGKLENDSPRLAMAIREAFNPAPADGQPPTSPPAAR